MTAITIENAKLNQLLIDLGRGLLQYVGECWPWTGFEDPDVHGTIDGLIDRQQRQISRLADLLARRGWPVDFGAYPTEYTDLHYVALDYLLVLLIDSEESLVAELGETVQSSSGDPEAAAVLEAILAEEHKILRDLRALTKARAVKQSNGHAGPLAGAPSNGADRHARAS